MFKELIVHATFGERTGYQIHASRFFPALDALHRKNKKDSDFGDVHISLLDVVTASQTDTRWPAPSILFTVWEATEYPQAFMDRLHLYDMMFVPSEWQRAASIAQGIPEEFVKVVPEGVSPYIYKPQDVPVGYKDGDIFNFVYVGQWQPRKSTEEICRAFINAFPDNNNVRLYLSADTLFPSDDYKSTEERLEAYGINDSRIIPVHFEEREDYIRRLQGAHCFVSCARSEGWGLPIIEAMACGIPTIVADWSGSTEYAHDAIRVPITKLIKPFGIYGNWDVPGQWCEPDFKMLESRMKYVVNKYNYEKGRALEISERIRRDFSWDAAAEKAFKHLQELHKTVERHAESRVAGEAVDDAAAEKAIRMRARKCGYEITEMHKSKIIFTVDCHPSSEERLETLRESIKQVKKLGYDILVTSHLPLPQPVIGEVDYYIYDKRDILSGDDLPVYSRVGSDGELEKKQASIPCHALAWLHNMRNAIDFCKGRYEWIYNMSFDAECDLADWIDKVKSSDKDLIATKWEGSDKTFNGQLIAGKVEMFDVLYPKLDTWEEFRKMFGEDRFCCERGYYKRAEQLIGLDKIDFVDIEIGNRFNQVDNNVWPDDVFACNYIDGPTLSITGISNREYDVSYQAGGKEIYSVKQKVGMWSKPATKYFMPWTIEATLNGEVQFRKELDLSGARVLISMGSKALGDTIAWMPYVDEFRKKHNCKVVCSGWWQEIFDYPEIEWVKPGSEVSDIVASYQVGCFDEQLHMNVNDWRLTPLQKVAADILGLDYEPIRAKLKFTPHKKGNGGVPEPYVCFSEFSTMRNKLWNRPGAWKNIINYLNEHGYKCVSISNEQSELEGIVKHNNQSIQNSIADIAGADFYIGLNAGPSWIAYALGVPVIMITGVSEEWNDFPNPHRIAINNEVCGIGCFNDPTHKIDRGWEWCPRNKNYACTAEITEEMVIKEIEKITGISYTGIMEAEWEPLKTLSI
jgi:autotransporter strand-loop-strand O-heptosyltransferase